MSCIELRSRRVGEMMREADRAVQVDRRELIVLVQAIGEIAV